MMTDIEREALLTEEVRQLALDTLTGGWFRYGKLSTCNQSGAPGTPRVDRTGCRWRIWRPVTRPSFGWT